MSHDASHDRAPERPVRFFGTYNAGDVGIPRLSVGCDRSLDEAGAVLRLRGSDHHDGELFDHFALTVDTPTGVLLEKALSDALDCTHDDTDYERLQMLRDQAQRLVRGAAEHDRLAAVLRAMHPGESLTLSDRAHTTITRTSGEYVIDRARPRTGAHCGDHHVAAAVALGGAPDRLGSLVAHIAPDSACDECGALEPASATGVAGESHSPAAPRTSTRPPRRRAKSLRRALRRDLTAAGWRRSTTRCAIADSTATSKTSTTGCGSGSSARSSIPSKTISTVATTMPSPPPETHRSRDGALDLQTSGRDPFPDPAVARHFFPMTISAIVNRYIAIIASAISIAAFSLRGGPVVPKPALSGGFRRFWPVPLPNEPQIRPMRREPLPAHRTV